MNDQMDESFDKQNNDIIWKAAKIQYQELYSNLLICLERQSNIIGWLIALIGAVVGALFTIDMPDNQPLILSLTQKSDNAFFMLALLSFSFVIAIELLIIYWIYQRYQIHRIKELFKKMDNELCKHFSVDAPLLERKDEWDDRTSKRKIKKLRFILENIQPIPLYLLAFMGIFPFGFSIYRITFCLWKAIIGPIILLVILYILGRIHMNVRHAV